MLNDLESVLDHETSVMMETIEVLQLMPSRALEQHLKQHAMSRRWLWRLKAEPHPPPPREVHHKCNNTISYHINCGSEQPALTALVTSRDMFCVPAHRKRKGS
jgi:hypothetical protein